MAMFPQFASTAASFTRASSLVFKVGTDAHLYDDPHDADIVRLLDSKFDAEKVEAMKRLLALMSQGCDVSSFFPQVVKSVASQNLEVKKLVYIYLVHYAEKRPDEALLSINTFQKDLVDFNPLVRAWALRAMSGIKLHVVAPLMLMAIQKCVKDPSPYVRKCAANAIPKLHILDTDQYHDALEQLVGLLLDDMSPGVVGAAIAAFLTICPDQLTLIGPRFHNLCELLPDVEEWGQVLLIDILLRYAIARHGMPPCRKKLFECKDKSEAKQLSSVCESFEKMACRESEVLIKQQNCVPQSTMDVKSVFHWTNHVEDDIKLLLQYTSPLLWSHNSAVVLAAAGVLWLVAPEEKLKTLVKPLLFLMRSSFDSQYVVMANLKTFVQERPDLFEDFYEDFFIWSSDTQSIRAIKLDILPMIATEASISCILQELQAYVRDCDRQFAAKAVSALGKCATTFPSVAKSCMESLLSLVKGESRRTKDCDGVMANITGKIGVSQLDSKKNFVEKRSPGDSQVFSSRDDEREAAVVTQAVLAMRSMMQMHFHELEKVFCRLARDLDLCRISAARAVVIWMIGEYGCNSVLIKDMFPSILKYLAACFLKEEAESKLQILNCICKIVIQSQTTVGFPLEAAALALSYILDLGSCDMNYDIRDRARMLRQLMYLHLKRGSLELPSNMLQNSSLNKVVDSLASFLDQYDEPASKSPISVLPEYILASTKLTSFNQSLPQDQDFLPGSMSHIVHHHAPGYRPLPEACSLKEPPQSLEAVQILENYSGDVLGKKLAEPNHFVAESDFSGSYSSGSTHSGSDNDDFAGERNGTVHSQTSESEPSSGNASQAMGIERSTLPNEVEFEPLIHLSDVEIENINLPSIHESDAQQSVSARPTLRSADELESWLQSSSLDMGQRSMEVSQDTSHTGFATLLLKSLNTEPKSMTLLNFTNGEGLEVKYSYIFSDSGGSQNMVCLGLKFVNRTTDVMAAISVKAWDSEANSVSGDGVSFKSSALKREESALIIPSEVIATLNPHQSMEGKLYINFNQQLMPVKLAVLCNGKQFPVKIAPDIGAFLRPKMFTDQAFAAAVRGLPGMFETTRRCNIRGDLTGQKSSLQGPDQETLSVATYVASTVLQNVNVFFISASIPVDMSAADAGESFRLHLKFSGETLAASMLCLITIVIEVKESVDQNIVLPVLMKVNCEDSVFGLNLLKRLQKALDAE